MVLSVCAVGETASVGVGASIVGSCVAVGDGNGVGLASTGFVGTAVGEDSGGSVAVMVGSASWACVDVGILVLVDFSTADSVGVGLLPQAEIINSSKNNSKIDIGFRICKK